MIRLYLRRIVQKGIWKEKSLAFLGFPRQPQPRVSWEQRGGEEKIHFLGEFRKESEKDGLIIGVFFAFFSPFFEGPGKQGLGGARTKQEGGSRGPRVLSQAWQGYFPFSPLFCPFSHLFLFSPILFLSSFFKSPFYLFPYFFIFFSFLSFSYFFSLSFFF